MLKKFQGLMIIFKGPSRHLYFGWIYHPALFFLYISMSTLNTNNSDVFRAIELNFGYVVRLICIYNILKIRAIRHKTTELSIVKLNKEVW